MRIEDLGSSNGTSATTSASSATLGPGDRIQVGPVKFIIQIDGEPADEQLNPDAPPPPAAEPYNPISDFAISPARAVNDDEEDKLVDFELDKPTESPGEASPEWDAHLRLLAECERQDAKELTKTPRCVRTTG